VTQLILVVLAVVWVAVLVPPFLRGRREGRPGDSINSFRQQLNVLERAAPSGRASFPSSVIHRPSPVRVPPRGYVAPATIASRRRARQRRRQVLQVLIGLALLTATLAVAAGGVFLVIHLAIDVVLVAYLALLVQMQRIAAVQYSALRYHRSAA
jgi:hypothetical protein